MKSRRRTIVQDAGVIGWISISEVFLLCGVTMLTIALAVESNLDETKVELENVKKAESEVPALKQTIDELQKDKVLDRRMIGELTSRLALSDEKASKLADDIARLRRELHDAGSERAALREALATLATDRDRLADDLKRRQTDLDRSRFENDALRQEIGKLKVRLAEIDEAIVRPLKAAKLIVKISCAQLPPGYDIDLYVQDPQGQVCSWERPRIFQGEDETGLMMLSEDLRDLRRTTEESFYSLTFEPSFLGDPYLVYCMLRAKPNAQAIPKAVPVHWEIFMAGKDGHDPIREKGVQLVAPGRVIYANNTFGFPGIVPLVGFRQPSIPNGKSQFFPKEEMPELPRGWSNTNLEQGAKYLNKSRDQ